jgi:hypothetical protein
MRRPHRSFFAVVLVALAITTAGASGAGAWKPVIKGTPQVGATLTADVSSWAGGPTTFTYQWSRCDVNGNACVALNGATAQTYLVVPADVGSTLRVTADPTKRQGTATSDPTAVVAPAPAPTPTPAPAPPPPSVTLTSSIANGAVLSGSVAWIVNANGSGVARVDFLIDGTKKWSEAYAPYYFNGDPNGTLDTTTLSNSTHTLLGIAYGSSGNELGRVSVGVTVSNGSTTPPPPPPSPTVTLTNSIANGSTISGSVQWVVSASGFGIVRIDFLVDGVKKWTEQQAPYQYNGDPSGVLDTTTLANGGHSLVAIAYDSNSVEIARATSSVTVSNTASSPPPPPPPTGTTTGWPRYGTANGWRMAYRTSSGQDYEIGQDVALGAKIVRIDGGTATDTAVGKLLAQGITPIVIFGSNPTYPWSTTPSQLASQASGFASKWGSRIMYECMNEVNIHGWTPDAYLPYLKAFHDAIKAVAPSATVLNDGLWTGSGSQALIPWSQRFIDLGGLNYTDAYNVHLYDDPAEHGSWSVWDMTFGSGGAGYYDTTNVRSLLDAWDASHGKPKLPIVSTESGGPVPKYTLTKQATIVTNALHTADGVGTGYRKLAFCLIYNVEDDDVAGFGLLDSSLNRRPSWYAFQTVATA